MYFFLKNCGTKSAKGRASSETQTSKTEKPPLKNRTASYGPYVQTTTRQLRAEKESDAVIYAKGVSEHRENFRVKFSFRGRSERELSVAKDDIVALVEKIDDKWAQCELKEKSGLLPVILFSIRFLINQVDLAKISFSLTLFYTTMGLLLSFFQKPKIIQKYDLGSSQNPDPKLGFPTTQSLQRSQDCSFKIRDD